MVSPEYERLTEPAAFRIFHQLVDAVGHEKVDEAAVLGSVQQLDDRLGKIIRSIGKKRKEYFTG